MPSHNGRFFYSALAFLIILAGIAGLTTAMPRGTPSPTIELASTTITVTIADTDGSREQGLGGRSGLGANEGMLFIFSQDGLYSFWMKDMRFSIDMLWLSDAGAVVYMAQDVSPDTYPEDFTPTTPARYVLELPAGWAASHDVQIGNIVRL